LEAVFEMPKQETRKSQRELSPASKVDVADMVQFARNCHRKTFVSLLLYVTLHCPHARPISFHISLYSTPSDNLGENISDKFGGREHLSFRHGMAWHEMTSTTWNP
jgi:hypothetical protein